MEPEELATGVYIFNLLNIPFAHFHFQPVIPFQNQPLAACGNRRFPSIVLVFQIDTACLSHRRLLTFSIYTQKVKAKDSQRNKLRGGLRGRRSMKEDKLTYHHKLRSRISVMRIKRRPREEKENAGSRAGCGSNMLIVV